MDCYRASISRDCPNDVERGLWIVVDCYRASISRDRPNDVVATVLRFLGIALMVSSVVWGLLWIATMIVQMVV